MIVQFNAKTDCIIIPKSAPVTEPITVDWSTTMQSLSTEFQHYDVNLEVTTEHKMVELFLRQEGLVQLTPTKPQSLISYIFCQGQHYTDGASLLIDVLLGETSKEKAVALVEGLGDRHAEKVKQFRSDRTKTTLNRPFMNNYFSLQASHHSFSVGEINTLARQLKEYHHGRPN